MKTHESFRKYWSFLIVYTLIIFFISTLPGSTFEEMPRIPFADKVAHVFLYLVLGFISLRTFLRGRIFLFSYFIFSLAYCIFVGALDEFYQSFVPQRVTDVRDLLADTIGAAVGALIYIKFPKAARFFETT